ncbi:hypothetical protein V8F20_002555 [Naviculisporaceae sp. PSN 640]
MSNIEEYHLRPFGWENDPEEERFPLSTVDYLSAQTYNNWALFFKLQDDPNKAKIISVLKQGLECTLSQTRHVVGTIEQDLDSPNSNNKNVSPTHSFVKRKISTVKFVVQHLDHPNSSFPSFSTLEKAHFVETSLGGRQNVDVLSNLPMTYGEKPEADPDNHPVVSSFKANFIPGGGLILIMHLHHYADDLAGWASFAQQLGENCAAIANDGDSLFPPWDPACLDRSRFTAPRISDEAALVDAPPQPDRHPDHRPAQSLMFHLPKSKAKALKDVATPPPAEANGTSTSWISTYDALVALTWRTLTRLRAPLYNLPPENTTPLWAEGINLTKRLTNPSLPERQQGNTFLPVLSAMIAPQIPPMTLSQLTDDEDKTPLWKLASYVRQVTNTCGNQAYLNATLAVVSPIRNKKDLSVRVDSFPPMSVAVTDWRDAGGVVKTSFGEADAGKGGLGKPRAFRHLWGDVLSEGLVVIYPPKGRRTDGVNGGEEEGDDEGIELNFAFEKELLDGLLGDEIWGRYFEFRGFDRDPVV